MITRRWYENSAGQVLYDSDDGWNFEYRGSGAYANIYRVSDGSEKECALKVFDPTDEEIAKETRKIETDTLQKLNGAGGHAPVCHSTGTYFEEEDSGLILREKPAYEMDFISGVTLEDAIRSHKAFTGDGSSLDGRQTLEVMEKVCEAVAACHSLTSGGGSVHRDLAPKNIMVDIVKEDASVSNAVIVDWGQAPRDNPYYTPGDKLGTPPYAAPELLRAEETEKGEQGEILEFERPTVDVWSLGAIAYFVRTAKDPLLPPFSRHDEKRFRKWADYREEHPISLPDCNGDPCDEYLNEFIRRCTKDNPKERFQNAGEAREDIVAYLQRYTPILRRRSASTDVWAVQYKLYRGNEPYSSEMSDLLIVGSSRASCVTTTYQWNGDTYIARPVGDVLNVKDEGVWLNEKEEGVVWLNIEVVDFIGDVKPASLTGWFAGCQRLKEIRHIDRLDTSAVQSFAGMFYNCGSLTSLDLSSFKTSNALTTRTMFFECHSLTSLDLSSFDTSNVTDMSYMFDGCCSLTSLDLSSFDTSNVTDADHMFNWCRSLTSLDLSSLDTSNVANMSCMFYRCHSLATLDLSSFDTSNVTDMRSMFDGCCSLTSLDLSSFDTSNATNMRSMFNECRSLTSLDLSSFDTSNVADMSSMFNECRSLTSLDLSSFDTSDVTNTSAMFCGCHSLTYLDLSSFDTSNVADMSCMFDGCYSLIDLDLSSFSMLDHH